MDIIKVIIGMLPATFAVSVPIIIAGLGGIISERAGVVNIALDGLMMVGGFIGATVVVFAEKAGFGAWAPWLSILVGGLAGMIFSLVLGVAIITFRSDHTIAGTAVNMLAAALSLFLCQIIFQQQRTEAFQTGFSPMKGIPIIQNIKPLNDFFSRIYPTVLLAPVLVVIVWFVLWKTPFGLRLRSCGENPQASASMGVNVYKIRYSAVLLSGFLAGLAGAILVLTSDTQFSNGSIHGMGFIAVAAVIFGKWNPFGLLGAGLFFGFTQTFAIYANDFPFLSWIPVELFHAIPYVFTIIALILFSSKAVGPKAAGEIYDEGKR